MAAEATRLDRINRRAWTSREAIRMYTRGKTWTDPGETAAFAWLAAECRDQPVLDIGIGAGRTIPHLTDISADYVGIDYTARLLERARARFPSADLRHMDARDMSALPSNHYALTEFSFNGIDAVDYHDRVCILTEMHRVTRPGGLVHFSTHNRDGPAFDQRPTAMPPWSANPLRFGWSVIRMLRQLPFSIVNYRRNKHLHRDFDGYSIRATNAHCFGIVMIYTTLPEQFRQLAEVGFDVEAVFGSDGRRIATAPSDALWFHVIARKM